jgi:hypothetical protein
VPRQEVRPEGGRHRPVSRGHGTVPARRRAGPCLHLRTRRCSASRNREEARLRTVASVGSENLPGAGPPSMRAANRRPTIPTVRHHRDGR